jgi:CMP-N-acetylneuraminic acid synthetase
MSKVLAIIPARGASVGVPRKNVKLLAGTPLIGYGIRALKDSGVIDRIVVATEDKEISEVARTHGAEVIEISRELADGTTEPVMAYVVEELGKQGYTPDYVALMQCTSPFLSPDVVRQAVGKVAEGNTFDSCITVFKPEGYEFKWRKDGERFIPEHDVDNRPRRQFLDLPYHENGAFYITRTDLFKKTKNRFGGAEARVTAIEMSEEDSLQIDSPLHWWLAEQLLARKNRK